ncbi:MAG: hypothetical protein ACOYBE_12125 [Blautia sp.]|jgi:hypothetical protein
MREKDWKQLFDQYRMPCPSQELKEDQIRRVLQAYRSMRPVHKKTKLQRWADAAGHLSAFTWFFQAVLLLLLGAAFLVDWIDALGVAVFTAPLLGIIGTLELMRSYAWNMWELEQSCRYHLPQMMGMKMVVLGILDFLVLIVFGVVGGCGGWGMNGFLIQILIPFLLSNAVSLWLMRRFRNSYGFGILLAAGLFMSVLNVQVSAVVGRYLRSISQSGGQSVILLVSLASAGILAVSIRQFLKSCKGEEKRTWSFN